MKLLTIIVAFLGAILLIRYFVFFQNSETFVNGQPMTLRLTLFSQPTESGRFQHLSVRLSDEQRLFITTGLYPRYHYGDILIIKGKLQVKESGQGSIYTLSFPKIEKNSSDNSFIGLLAPLREHIIRLFHTSLSQPESSLLLGIVFGIAESMPKEFQTLLSSAGVLHVIAASGMNVTMIGGFLTAIFGKVLRRQYALLASIVAIIFYAALAGFTASIVRASIMGILVFSAQIIGRQTLALYGLLLAGFLMLFFQPFLLFDTGFQLSFMATWGLIVFSPLVQSVLPKHGKIAELLAESDFSTTFIAQVVTLPILLGTFGSYSPVSILANFLVLWTIPILMIVGAAGTLVGLVMPFFGRWLLYLSLPLLIYFETVVRFLGGLPVGFKIEKVAWEVSLGYYLLLLALLVWLRRRKADA